MHAKQGLKSLSKDGVKNRQDVNLNVLIKELTWIFWEADESARGAGRLKSIRISLFLPFSIVYSYTCAYVQIFPNFGARPGVPSTSPIPNPLQTP